MQNRKLKQIKHTNNCSNPVKKKAAELAGKKAKDEAYKKADQAQDEAFKKADNIMANAKQKADNLK
jgi:hypothetical protein